MKGEGRVTIKIELTPEQERAIKQLTGKSVPTVKLQLEEVEARIAPGIWEN